MTGLTIGDEGPAGQHSAQHELDHSQEDAQHPTDDGHAEQEVILGRQEEKEKKKCGGWRKKGGRKREREEEGGEIGRAHV